MKLYLIILFVSLSGMIVELYAQVDDPKKTAEEKGVDRTNEQIDKQIDKGYDKLEEGIGNIFGKKKKKPAEVDPEDKISESTGETVNKESGEGESGAVSSTGPELDWSKYDFVPGEIILFEDILEGEENGEFPSRWDLVEGVVENAKFNNENVIYFRAPGSTIIPYVKDPEHDYLPETFTFEFDAWFETDEYAGYMVLLYDVKNQEYIHFAPIDIRMNAIRTHMGENIYPGAEYEYDAPNSLWRHISISFNKRSLKIYLDDARIFNIPNMEIDPTGITLKIDGFNTAGVKGINRIIKNVRLAEGAVKLYDRMLSEGKIIANGIRFDVNKAVLRPESMGIINEIAGMMNEHPEIIFSIEGHTDSDGDNEFNLKLSEERAAAVKNKLIELGISTDRLSIKGFGETVPVSNNSTPEGKANNRRVEFVKM
jgi:OmpA-OmpF porin, OOP family